jgi:uncharacterized protein YneF (UPF0154 family)
MNETIILAGGILGIAGFIVSCICVAMVAGFTRSTHTVQYLPHDNTAAFKAEPDLVEQNEKALLDKVGKKFSEKPKVVQDLDEVVEEITKTDVNF